MLETGAPMVSATARIRPNHRAALAFFSVFKRSLLPPLLFVAAGAVMGVAMSAPTPGEDALIGWLAQCRVDLAESEIDRVTITFGSE